MSTSPETVAHILDTLAALPGLRAAKMFGEYGVWLDTKSVALICDDTLFVKPIPAATALLPGVPTGTPYPGAKEYLVLDEILDTPELVIAVLRAVAAAAPEPKPKKPKAAKTKEK